MALTDGDRRRRFKVTPDMQRAKRPVSRPIAGPYGHPYHPALVTVPIGAWSASLIFDIGSRLVSKPALLTTGSKWLIVIGIAGAIAASIAGFLDLASLAEGTAVYRTACAHMTINLALIFAYVANFEWRERVPARTAPVSAGMLALSGACVALLAVSGFLGGRLAYRYGVRVADEATQAAGYRVGRHNA
jgi:uncharacterized membrane protein